jgi:hypothetical protein
MEGINIWELGDRINVKIDDDFSEKIRSIIRKKYLSFPKFYAKFNKHFTVSFSVLRNRLKPKYKNFVDLEIYVDICKLIGIQLVELQEHILAYKSRRGRNSIEKPILPVKITPIFDMLIAHHIGDGTVINAQKGWRPYFGYRQFNNKYRLLYLQKIESVFGKLSYKKEYFKDENNTRIYCPTVVSDLMFRLYGLNSNSFRSEIARIPQQVLKKDWKHKLAFLIGLIIDEGFVDSTLIAIRVKNHELIQDLGLLCSDLAYRYTITKEENGYASLYILSQGLSKFYKDYLILLDEYPEVDLGHKGVKIKEFIDRLDKPKRYRHGNKQKILALLSNETLTVNELATKLNMTRQGARYLIHQLEDEEKVEVKSIVKYANWKYGIKGDVDCSSV